VHCIQWRSGTDVIIVCTDAEKTTAACMVRLKTRLQRFLLAGPRNRMKNLYDILQCRPRVFVIFYIKKVSTKPTDLQLYCAATRI